MRLLLTTDAVGGVWQYTAELAVALAARGVTSTVAVLGPPPTADQRAMLDAAGKAVTLVVTGLPLDWTCSEAAPVEAAGAAIAALAVSRGVDLIHYNMPTLAAAGAPLPSIAVAHGCVATWWQAARDVPLAAEYRWHRALTAAGLRAVDRVVAPSAAYAEIVARHYALARPVVAIHNGRSLPEIDAAGAQAEFALTVGRLWDDVKNAALLDRAAARLPIPFLAAGATRGPHGETIRLEHLRLLGELSGAQLSQHLARRPIFVSAARFEPFGLAVLEAAQAGCALILADIPTFRELWTGAALFVPPDGHGHGWCRTIETLALDAARRAALGDAARLRAARYTPETTADRMLALYRATLAQPTTQRVAA